MVSRPPSQRFGEFAMYLLYVDDSGSAANRNEEYFVLGGVSVFERSVYHLSKSLDQLAAKHDAHNPARVEFHASEIFRGKTPPWDRIRSRDDRRQVLKDVLQVLADDHYGNYAFAVAVHKRSYPGRDPVELAFEELCNRFNRQLVRENESKEKKHHQRGLIIFDQSAHETALQQLVRNFRDVGTRWGVIKNLADVPLFVDSRSSRLIQLADHVAYSVFRFYEHDDNTYLKVVLPKFHADIGGTIHGLIHKQMVEPKCMCPACMSRR